MAGALLKPKLCINTPFGQEENHVWAKHCITTDFRRASCHLASARYPEEAEPKNRYSGLGAFLLKRTQYVYELIVIEELLDTMNRAGKCVLVWNRHLDSFDSFQAVLTEILQSQNACQKAFYKNVDTELKRLFNKPKDDAIHAADAFRNLLACDVSKTIRKFIQRLEHARFFTKELKEIEKLFLSFQREASFYKAYAARLLENPHDVMRAKKDTEKKCHVPINEQLFTFVLHELHKKVGEGVFFSAVRTFLEHTVLTLY
jgi:hypothetical protein